MNPSSLPFLMITLITIILMTTTTPLPAAANFSRKEQLATTICRSTTDFAFCRAVIYSDPRAPTADRYILNYIAINKAFKNATDIRQYISRLQKSGGGGNAVALKKCAGLYDKALSAISQYYGNLDSESYYDLDELAIEAGNCANACEASFRGRSPLSKRNGDMRKIANICLAAAKLFS